MAQPPGNDRPVLSTQQFHQPYHHDRNQSLPNASLNREREHSNDIPTGARPARAATFSRTYQRQPSGLQINSDSPTEWTFLKTTPSGGSTASTTPTSTTPLAADGNENTEMVQTNIQVTPQVGTALSSPVHINPVQTGPNRARAPTMIDTNAVNVEYKKAVMTANTGNQISTPTERSVQNRKPSVSMR